MKSDRADVDPHVKCPLSEYGRDEKYILNKLWLMGASTVILHGVGDGMIPFCCLKRRIPCVLIYDPAPGGIIHKDTIRKFLIDKVKQLLAEAVPGDTRFYRTDVQLGCRPAVVAKEAASSQKEKKLPAAEKEKKETDKRSRSGSSSSSSSPKRSKTLALEDKK